MTSEHIIAIVSAIFVSSGFWNFITKWWETKNNNKSVESRAILALLHDKLYYLCSKHIDAGYITVDELDNLTYLYKPYREMGGNGICEQLYNECLKLPKKKEVSK